MLGIENIKIIRFSTEIPFQLARGFSAHRPNIQILTSENKGLLLPESVGGLNAFSRANPDIFGGAVWDDPRPLSLASYTLRASLYGFDFNPRLVAYIAGEAYRFIQNDLHGDKQHGGSR